MTRRIISFAGISSALLTGLILIFVGWGVVFAKTLPPLANLDACALPCWNGITPGITSLREARALLLDQGYAIYDRSMFRGRIEYRPPAGSNWCSAVLGSFDDTIVGYLHLIKCGDSRMGDIAGLLNRAEGTTSGYLLGWGPTYRQRSVTLLAFGRSNLSPHSQDFFVLLTAPSDATLFPWFGFMSWQQYCLREPSACRMTEPMSVD